MSEEILADQESGGQDLEVGVNRLSWVEFLECPQLAHLQSGDDELCLLTGHISLWKQMAQLSSLILPVQTLQTELKTGPDTAFINSITPWPHTEVMLIKAVVGGSAMNVMAVSVTAVQWA